ncbi:unnamed protein product, partial [Staurois parvus]
TGSQPEIPRRHPAIAKEQGQGRAPTCCFVLPCIAEQYKAAYFLNKIDTAHTVKQHTINSLITPDVNPFLPNVISTVSVLFISTD